MDDEATPKRDSAVDISYPVSSNSDGESKPSESSQASTQFLQPLVTGETPWNNDKQRLRPRTSPIPFHPLPPGGRPLTTLHLTAQLSTILLPPKVPPCQTILSPPQTPVTLSTRKKENRPSWDDNFVSVEGMKVGSRGIPTKVVDRSYEEILQRRTPREDDTPKVSKKQDNNAHEQHSCGRIQSDPTPYARSCTSRVLSGTFSRDGIRLVEIPASTTRKLSFNTVNEDGFSETSEEEDGAVAEFGLYATAHSDNFKDSTESKSEKISTGGHPFTKCSKPKDDMQRRREQAFGLVINGCNVKDEDSPLSAQEALQEPISVANTLEPHVTEQTPSNNDQDQQPQTIDTPGEHLVEDLPSAEESTTSDSQQFQSTMPITQSGVLDSIIDNDLIQGDLVGWTEVGQDVFSAFHQAQARRLGRARRDDAYRQQLHTPAKANVAFDQPGEVHSKALPVVQSNSISHSTSVVTEEPLHPLARHGYTTTSTWKVKKDKRMHLRPEVDERGKITRKSRTRPAEPTYKDGYLFDTNLPLRLNFVHPILLPDGTEKEDDGIPSDSDDNVSSTGEPCRPVLPDPYAEPLNQTMLDLPEERATESPCPEPPQQTEPVEEVRPPSAEAGALAPAVESPEILTDPATAQWRHQRNVAALTMKELKKIFPPLMKQYLGRRRSDTKGRARHASKELYEPQPHNKRMIPPKPRHRHSLLAGNGNIGLQQTMWKTMDAEFQAQGKHVHCDFGSTRLPGLALSNPSLSDYSSSPLIVPFGQSHSKQLTKGSSEPHLSLPFSISLPTLVHPSEKYRFRVKQALPHHPARKKCLDLQTRTLSDPSISLSLSSSLALMRSKQASNIEGANRPLMFPAIVSGELG
ncbi:uncharacterized protein SPPG_07944 [Spizellomyces punctatus DAOM BR117]|uniref:Uncharacterized protein n=1 Tax=Spizellomyces punctatus (strain DAOM BR117) TaxID=645134 RepID=A0A0L0H774_SPIPD|nr:uncharacterized protein SPPG_07944 [Spizellomyces punctatus DAOM BR117]KNC96736.1 hypothetical protein SPPG_07944 [Spizellomyces punctatus DAOM BR117]|eukprot:XP_016604776.1 hypothetical protein SPPG_07944 [Spizellomyces punctatus DAOM BR117]